MNKLSEFPTEALLYQYRQHRYCRRMPIYDYYLRYTKSGKIEVWKRIYGDFEGYNICLYMTLSNKTKEEVIHEHTSINSKDGGLYYKWDNEQKKSILIDRGNFMKIHFGKLHWEGNMEEVKKELSTRPNVNIDGSKEYRKWLYNYKKTNRP